MANPTWNWAELNAEQQRLLAEAERALDADFLLAFKPAVSAAAQPVAPIAGLTAAPLSDSQLECLNGLEAQLQSVVVAYRRSAG
jgi:hypothetical protein